MSRVKILGLVLLLGALGWLLYLSIEFYDEEIETAWSLRALTNPYLAAQQFMEAAGTEVTDAASLAELAQLDDVGTLFVGSPNQIVDPRQLRQLREWMEGGGRVIYAASSVAHDEDLLLEAFDVEVRWRDADDNQEDEQSMADSLREYNRQIEQGKSREDIGEAMAGEPNLTIVEYGGAIGDLEIAFDDSKVLTHPYIIGTGYDVDKPIPDSWHYSDYGVHFMQFDVGDGELNLVVDPGVWTSFRIDQHDHAYLLWLLAGGDARFAILRPILQDSIWTLFARNARELLIAGGLLLLLWIWHLGHRFGRLVPRDLSRTRALAEHFSSIAHYLWHRRQGEYLIEPLRQRILRRASLQVGEFATAAPERQIELLAERSDLNPDAIERALNDNDFNESTFVQKVRLLKRIEQSL